MSEWISIKDELPELKTWVLVYTYQREDREPKRKRRETAYRYKMDNCDRELFSTEGGSYPWIVTHWMNLPEPPKE